MRRGLLLLAVTVLVFVPSWAGAMPVLHFYGTGSVAVDAATGNNVFTGDISNLSATGAPQNNGTYTAPAGSALVQIYADLGFGLLSTDQNMGIATLGYTGPGGTFDLPYYFLQMGIYAVPTPFVTTVTDVLGNSTITDIWGMGSDMKANPSFDVGAISPFESFFGIGAVDDQYGFTFHAWLDRATGLLNFDLSNTPTALKAPIVTPEPGTLLLLGLGLVGLVGVSRRKIF